MKIKNGQSAAKQILLKPIIGWETLYSISEDGRVFSHRKQNFLKPRLSMDGYNRVCLCSENGRYEYRIARLVADTFIENPDKENKSQVNHIDFNRQNDIVSNLEWTTPIENTNHSIKNVYKSDLRNTDGTFIKKAYTFNNVYNDNEFIIIGINEIVSQFKCSSKNVKAILNKYSNTGMFVKNGLFKGLKVDSEYLKVQRLGQSSVGPSGSKCETSQVDEDIV
jgi:hypothetical protein